MPGVASCPVPGVAWYHTLRQPIVALVQPVVGASRQQDSADRWLLSSGVAREVPAYCRANEQGQPAFPKNLPSSGVTQSQVKFCMINMCQSPGVVSMSADRLLLLTSVVLERVGRACSLAC